MREIKVRGIRLDNNKWIYGSLWINKTATGETAYIIDDNGDNYAVDANTVGEYIDLKDCGDTEIYEGDIFTDRLMGMAVVEWAGDARFLGFTIGKRMIIYVGREPKVKVIGNIHKNPELLGMGE